MTDITKEIFYSDVGTYPEGMFLVVEKLIENYIAFAHMGEASYLAPIGQRFEEKNRRSSCKTLYCSKSKEKTRLLLYRYL